MGKRTDELLEDILDELNTIRKVLTEKNDGAAPPYYPTTPQAARCPRCGITLQGFMGYVCTDLMCPTFSRASCVSGG